MRIGLGIIAVLISCCWNLAAHCAEPQVQHSNHIAITKQDVLKALAKRTSVEFKKTPLHEVCKSLANTMGVNVWFDERALADAGADRDTPISIALNDVPTKSALRWITRPLDLAYLVRSSGIVITTPEEAGNQTSAVVYEVADLIRFEKPLSGEEFLRDYDSLIELFVSTIAPTSWGEGNNLGIEPLMDCLAIDQVAEVHEQIVELLSALRLAKQRQGTDQSKSAIRAADEDTIAFESQAAVSLDRVVSVDLREKTLADFLEYLRDITKLNILLDTKAALAMGIDGSSAMSLTLERVTVRTVLDAACQKLGIVWCLRDHALVFTTAEVGGSELYTVVYPIADLSAADIVSNDDGWSFVFQAVRGTCKPGSWDEAGGPGTLTLYGQVPVLVVSQTRDGHACVASFLGDLRKATKGQVSDEKTAETLFDTRVYVFSHVGTSVPTYEQSVKAAGEAVKVVKKVVEPSTWNEEGAAIEVVGDSIVVRQRRLVLKKVSELLVGLGYVDGTKNVNGQILQGGGGFFNLK